jgi:hypothetical protein
VPVRSDRDSSDSVRLRCCSTVVVSRWNTIEGNPTSPRRPSCGESQGLLGRRRAAIPNVDCNCDRSTRTRTNCAVSAALKQLSATCGLMGCLSRGNSRANRIAAGSRRKSSITVARTMPHLTSNLPRPSPPWPAQPPRTQCFGAPSVEGWWRPVLTPFSYRACSGTPPMVGRTATRAQSQPKRSALLKFRSRLCRSASRSRVERLLGNARTPLCLDTTKTFRSPRSRLEMKASRLGRRRISWVALEARQPCRARLHWPRGRW